MTVSELIASLNNLPQDQTVWVGYGNGFPSDSPLFDIVHNTVKEKVILVESNWVYYTRMEKHERTDI